MSSTGAAAASKAAAGLGESTVAGRSGLQQPERALKVCVDQPTIRIQPTPPIKCHASNKCRANKKWWANKMW